MLSRGDKIGTVRTAWRGLIGEDPLPIEAADAVRTDMRALLAAGQAKRGFTDISDLTEAGYSQEAALAHGLPLILESELSGIRPSAQSRFKPEAV